VNRSEIHRRLTTDFQPCSLRTSDGREVVVRRPDGVLVGDHHIAVLDQERHVVILDALHVVAIRALGGPAQGGARA
jgi:hypothetical protein